MPRVKARHIQVANLELCETLKMQLSQGADFAELATEHSECPTGKQKGDLGLFAPGQMAPAIDKVVFHEDVGKTYGPIKTKFGFHLIDLIERID